MNYGKSLTSKYSSIHGYSSRSRITLMLLDTYRRNKDFSDRPNPNVGFRLIKNKK